MDKASFWDAKPHLTSNARLQRCGSIVEFVDLTLWRFDADDDKDNNDDDNDENNDDDDDNNDNNDDDTHPPWIIVHVGMIFWRRQKNI